MLKETPLLTISLLSCGKSKYMKNCLESLMPLRAQLPCEIIAVDTGCDKAAHRLLEQYADQVISFAWCNDFAQARNAGLKAAHGKWFLYIDDDEWFINVDEIVHFFLSGEYERYGYACYLVRNFDDLEECRYTDAWVFRMIKREADTQFKNTIHEELTPVMGNCKLLHSTVKHFGYVFESKADAVQHSRRNISLLQAQLRTDRDNTRWWTHLLLEYAGLEEYIKLQEFCEEGLAHFSKISNATVNRDRGALYSGLLMAELSSYQFDKAAQDFETAIADARNTDLCRAHLYYMGAMAYFELQQYENCESCAAAYVKLADQLAADEEKQFLQATALVEDAFTEREKNKVLSYLIGSAIKQKKFSVLAQYGSTMDWDTGGLNFYPTFIEDVIQCLSELLPQHTDEKTVSNDIAEIVDFIRNLLDKKTLETFIWDGLVKLLLNQPQLMTHPFIESLNLPHRMADISFDKWKGYVDTFCPKNTEDMLEKLRLLLAELTQKGAAEVLDIRYGYFCIKEKERKLLIHFQQLSCRELRSLLLEFSEYCIEFYGEMFAETAFKGQMELLPPICRIAVQIKEIFDLEDQQEYSLFREKMTAAIGLYPPFDKILQYYAQTFAKEYRAKNAETGLQTPAPVTSEMQELAKQIAEKAQILIAEGLLSEAQQIIQQVKTLMPDAPEIAELEKQILSKMS